MKPSVEKTGKKSPTENRPQLTQPSIKVANLPDQLRVELDTCLNRNGRCGLRISSSFLGALQLHQFEQFDRFHRVVKGRYDPHETQKVPKHLVAVLGTHFHAERVHLKFAVTV